MIDAKWYYQSKIGAKYRVHIFYSNERKGFLYRDLNNNINISSRYKIVKFLIFLDKIKK